jgi:hypothetical protein
VRLPRRTWAYNAATFVSELGDGNPQGLPVGAILRPATASVRTELLEWFRREAKPLAGAYEGAITLLEQPQFPGRIHFICHAVRDIADRLVFVLDPQSAGKRVQYEEALDTIQKEWPAQASPVGDGTPAARSDTVIIPAGVARRIDQLIRDHAQRRTRPNQYQRLFRLLMRNDSTHAETNARLTAAFKEIREWFMRYTHLRSDQAPAVDEAELKRRFESFERILHSFVGGYFTGTKELDVILQQANR